MKKKAIKAAYERGRKDEFQNLIGKYPPLKRGQDVTAFVGGNVLSAMGFDPNGYPMVEAKVLCEWDSGWGTMYVMLESATIHGKQLNYMVRRDQVVYANPLTSSATPE